MNWIYILNRGLLVFALLGGLVFIVTYHLTARWWRSDIGRNMMTFVASETLILALSVTVWLFGDFALRPLVGGIAFGLFTVASWWRALVLIRALRGRDKAQR